jgi:hypothetical protein
VTNKPAEYERTITEIGRELLKYLLRRIEELGTNQASYRQARVELLRILADNRDKRSFNWGFEAVFTEEIQTLEHLGLVAVKYGSGAIMAGRTNAKTIYNVSLTDDGQETARVIIEREGRSRSETSKLGSSDSGKFNPADDVVPIEDENTDIDPTT